jgi:hypothetical protein
MLWSRANGAALFFYLLSFRPTVIKIDIVFRQGFRKVVRPASWMSNMLYRLPEYPTPIQGYA